MIISCSCGKYQFLVNKKDLPAEGRDVQCGICGEKWFHDFKASSVTSIKSAPASKSSGNWFYNVIIFIIFLTFIAGIMNLLKSYILINIPELKIYYILLDNIMFELKNIIQSLNL